MANFDYNPVLYDLQVNWEARLEKEIGFLREIISGNMVERLLDIGCGTAHHLQALSPYLKSLVGIDPHKATIDYAKERVATAQNIELEVGGFEDLDRLDLGKFDLVLSLGNTLPLLKTRRKVKLALKACRKKLARGGLVLFQFLNFKRNMIQSNSYYRPKSTSFEGKRYIFLKHFEYGKVNTRADFLITELDLEGKVTGFWVNVSDLCTIEPKHFLKMAGNAGYSRIMLFGPEGKQKFDPKKHISLYALLNI